MLTRFQQRASYRFRYIPSSGEKGPLPVWSQDALKNRIIKKIDVETKKKIGLMLDEIGGLGAFLQEYESLARDRKREKLSEFTDKFYKASLRGPINSLEADTSQIFYLYVVQAVKELLSHSEKTKKIIRKYKKLTRNMLINSMIRLRENTPLHIYLNYL